MDEKQFSSPITISAETPRSRVDGVIFVRDFPSCPQGMLAVGPEHGGVPLLPATDVMSMPVSKGLAGRNH